MAHSCWVQGEAQKYLAVKKRSAIIIGSSLEQGTPAAAAAAAALGSQALRSAPSSSNCLIDVAGSKRQLVAPMLQGDEGANAIVLDHIIGPGGYYRKDVSYCVKMRGQDMWWHVRSLPASCRALVLHYNKAKGLTKKR
jgi:hypothetical protein